MSVNIRKRGKAYQVRYRRGGRAYPVEYAGTFHTLREAKTRRDLVAGWLAGGQDPKRELARIANPTPRRTFTQAAREYEQSRLDLADSSRTQIATRVAMLEPLIGDRVLDDLTPADIQHVVALLAAERSPGTVRNYLQTIRQILDHAEVDPNPARHRSVKPPRAEQEEVNPPPAAHVLAILARVRTRFRLPIVVLEQTAMRVGELESLCWGDVDVLGSRFRLRSAATKTGRARWVQVPAWLMGHVADLCPVEDRLPERRVFTDFDGDALRYGMRQACKLAQVPHVHPHDLRHRRASLWHGQGVSAAELAKRGGWAKATVPLETYAHVLGDMEEVPVERYEEALT